MGMKKKRNQEISLKNRKRSSDTFRQHTLIVHSCSGWIFFGFLKKFLDFFCFFISYLLLRSGWRVATLDPLCWDLYFKNHCHHFSKKNLVRMYLDFLKITTSDFFCFLFFIISFFLFFKIATPC